MTLASNPFKAALRAGDQQIGLWHGLGAASASEILATSGADWVLIDGEHSPLGIETTLNLLRAMGGASAAPVVRPLWNDMLLLKQLLDIGATNLLIPNVQSAVEAERAVAGCRYPPRGLRGMASGVVRASGYGLHGDYVARCEEELCLLVQVETQRGFDNIEAIAAVPGIDGIFVGPADLAADLGLTGRPGDPRVVALVERALTRIREAGVAAGVLTVDASLARRYMDAGSIFTAVGVDVAMLAGAARGAVKAFKGAPEGDFKL